MTIKPRAQRTMNQLIVVAAAAAALCVTMAQAQEQYAGSECVGVVDFPLSEDPAYDNVYLKESAVFTNLETQNLVPPYLKESIQRSLRATFCLEIFAPAAVEHNTPCADACQSFYSQLEGGVTSSFLPAWINNFNFPTLEECDAYPTTDCQAGGEPIRYEADKAVCPLNYERISPSDYKSDGDLYYVVKETDCSPACPVRLYGESEWNLATRLAFGLSWAGSILSAVVLTCYLYYKKNQQLVMFFTVSCFVSSFAVAVFLSFGGVDTLVCMSDTVWHEKSRACVAQGTFTVWGFISAVCWTVCQALDVYARVVLEYRHTKIEKVRQWYPVVGGLVPVVAVAVLLITGHIGYDVRSPFDVCFIIKGGQEEYLYVFFIGVQAAACFACFCMMVGVVVRITNVMSVWNRNPATRGSMSRPSHVSRSSGAKVKSESVASRTLRYNSRPLMFIGLCMVICLINVVFVVTYIDNEDEVYSGAVDYATCIFTVNARGIDDDATIDECGRLYDDRHPVEVHGGITAGVSCLAIIPFLVYGYSLPPTRTFLSWLTNRHFSSTEDHQDTSDQDSGSIFTWRRNGRSRQSASSTRARTNMELADLQHPHSPKSPKSKSDSAARESINRRSEDSQIQTDNESNSMHRVNSLPVIDSHPEENIEEQPTKTLKPKNSGSANSAGRSEKAPESHDVEAQESVQSDTPGTTATNGISNANSSKSTNDKGSDWAEIAIESGQQLSPAGKTRTHYDL